MKKNPFIACLLLFLSVGTGGGLAFAQVPTNVDYLRTMSMGAYDDGIAAALFNPAATAGSRFEDGFYAQVSDQMSFIHRALDWRSRPNSTPVWDNSLVGINGLFMFKYGPMAFRLTLAAPDRQGDASLTNAYADNTGGNPSGGGANGVNQNLANYTFSDRRWELGLGGSYALTDLVAVSADARLILDGSAFEAKRLSQYPPNAQATPVIAYSDTTMGAGVVGLVGVHFSPLDMLAVSVNARTPSIVIHNHKVSGTYPQTSAGTMAAADYTTREVGGAQIGVGLQFKVYDMIRINADVAYQFAGSEKQTKGAAAYINDKLRGESVSAGVGADWQIKKQGPDAWGLKVGAGARYIWQEAPANYPLTSAEALRPLGKQIQVGAGAVYSPASFFDLSFSAMHAFRLDETEPKGNVGGVKTNDWYANIAVTIKPSKSESPSYLY